MANSPWKREALIYIPRKKKSEVTQIIQSVNVIPTIQSKTDYYKNGSTYRRLSGTVTGFARLYCYNPNVVTNLKIQNKSVAIVRAGSNYMAYCRFYKMSSGYSMTDLVNNVYWDPASLSQYGIGYVYYCGKDNIVYRIKDTTQSKPYMLNGLSFRDEIHTIDGIEFSLQHTQDDNQVIQSLQNKLGGLYYNAGALIISNYNFTDDELLAQVRYGLGYTKYNTVSDFDMGV